MGTRVRGLILLWLCALPVVAGTVRVRTDGRVRTYALLSRQYGIRVQFVATRGTIPVSFLTAKLNPEAHRRFARSGKKRLTVALDRVAPTLRREVLEKVFPKDGYRGNGWRHRVVYGGVESMWRVAQWFTGSGANYRAIQRANRLRRSTLMTGTWIAIPDSLLLAVFRPAPPARSVPNESKGNELTYGADKKGPYAVYRLKKGEALYSSVVVRFTGRLDADAVHELVDVIVKRNHIKDVTDMPVGYPVKIPLEYLLPEYQPKTSKAYQEYLAEQKETEDAAKETRIVATGTLDNVAIILDSGHGGRDIGARYNGVWEDDYMYDLVCRIKRTLEKETRATVIPTVYDKSSRYVVQDRRELPMDDDEYLRTTPMFPLNSRRVTSVGVHLRWYMANYQYRKLRKSGIPDTHIVFLSFHADALYYRLNGTMVYVPSASRKLYRSKIQLTSRRYQKYLEYRDQPRITFTRKGVLRAEGVSRKFARILTRQLKADRIPIHAEKPIRSYIVRSRRSGPFVPAVVKYSKPMVRCLVEVGNLRNKGDANRIRDPEFRERFARSVVRALIRFYRGNGGSQAESRASLYRRRAVQHREPGDHQHGR